MDIFKHRNYSYVTVVKVPKSEVQRLDFARCKEPRETLESFYKRQKNKPAILMNGGLFDMSDGNACMNFMDEGRMISEDPWSVVGMGIVDDATLIYSNLTDRNDWRDFVTGFPPLVVAGARAPITMAQGIDYKTRRSVIGYDAEHIFLITIDSPGMHFEEMQHMLISIGCDYAINLDGGGSTRMLHNGKLIVGGKCNRAVDNVVALYLKTGEEHDHFKIYRVQVGAFSQRSKAVSLRDEVRTLPDTIDAGYAHAYVRKNNDLYKVQVGAFTEKAGAVRVQNDLADKGYSAFVTVK